MNTEPSSSAYPGDPTMLDKGLNKREYMASIALAATNSTGTPQERAQEAVALADALIEALNNQL